MENRRKLKDLAVIWGITDPASFELYNRAELERYTLDLDEVHNELTDKLYRLSSAEVLTLVFLDLYENSVTIKHIQSLTDKLVIKDNWEYFPNVNTAYKLLDRHGVLIRSTIAEFYNRFELNLSEIIEHRNDLITTPRFTRELNYKLADKVLTIFKNQPIRLTVETNNGKLDISYKINGKTTKKTGVSGIAFNLEKLWILSYDTIEELDLRTNTVQVVKEGINLANEIRAKVSNEGIGYNDLGCNLLLDGKVENLCVLLLHKLFKGLYGYPAIMCRLYNNLLYL